MCPRGCLKTDVYLHLDEEAVPCRLNSPGANTLYTASKCNGCIKVSKKDLQFECNAEVIACAYEDVKLLNQNCHVVAYANLKELTVQLIRTSLISYQRNNKHLVLNVIFSI